MKTAFVGGVPLALALTGIIVLGPELLPGLGHSLSRTDMGILPLAILGAVVSIQVLWATTLIKRL